jgi:hypothetical protein
MNAMALIVRTIRYWLARILFYGGIGAGVAIIGWRTYLALARMFIYEGNEAFLAWQLRLNLGVVLALVACSIGIGIALDFERKLPGRRRPRE